MLNSQTSSQWVRSFDIPRTAPAVIMVANVITNRFLSEWISGSAADTSVRDLFVELAGNPALLALFVGLLIPLGAASEEVIRVFLLSRLWKVWPSATGKAVAVASSAFQVVVFAAAVR